MADDTAKIAKNLENLASLMTTFSKVIIEQTKATQEQTAAFREQSKKLDDVLDLRRRLKTLEEEGQERALEDARWQARFGLLAKLITPAYGAAAAGIGTALYLAIAQ